MRQDIRTFTALGLTFPGGGQAARHSNEKFLRTWIFMMVGCLLRRCCQYDERIHAVLGRPHAARAQLSAHASRDTKLFAFSLPATQRQPRARTIVPTSGSSARTASAEAAPRLSSLSAASADHSFMASCLQQRDASTVARRLLSARLPGGGPKAWVVVIKVL